MRYFVEQLVPSDFLLKQGVYLQTCAHIELVVWRIVQMVEGVDPYSRQQVESYIRLKLKTRDIVKRLRKAATRCHAPLGLRMLMLADRIEVGLANRNMAAHGAWKLHNSGHLEVEHYLTNKDRELRYVSEQIRKRDVETALEDADLILREAAELHDTFRSVNRTFFSFTAQNDAEPQPPSPRKPDQPNQSEVQSNGLANIRRLLMISTTLSRGLANSSH